MNTPRSRLRSTAYHMVEASLGPWIGCHGATGRLVVVDQPGLRELAAGGHPPVLSVDEEPRHAAR